MAHATELHFGSHTWSVTVPPEKAVPLHRPESVAAVGTPRELVRAALERPFGFEPMRRALTPDDRVAVVFDAALPHAAELLAGVLDHLGTAGIAPAAVTVLTPPGSPQTWIDELPDEFADATAETHDPADRKKLAYLASTKAERRIYLNRTLVESDFAIVLSGRQFDADRGYTGAPVAVFPALSNEEARAEPTTAEESLEVAWLLGTPFLVQAIEGTSGTVHEVVAGLLDSEAEGRRRQDARWLLTADRKADAAVVTVSGERVTFDDLAAAAVCAARVVRKGGRIAILTAAAPELGDGVRLMRTLDEPRLPKNIPGARPADWAACKRWCAAARFASLFLASDLPDDVAEELFTTPLHTAAEVQRLIDAADSVLVIPDAHKARVEIN